MYYAVAAEVRRLPASNLLEELNFNVCSDWGQNYAVC